LVKKKNWHLNGLNGAASNRIESKKKIKIKIKNKCQMKEGKEK
jgi:hypothetical protein